MARVIIQCGSTVLYEWGHQIPIPHVGEKVSVDTDDVYIVTSVHHKITRTPWRALGVTVFVDVVPFSEVV